MLVCLFQKSKALLKNEQTNWCNPIEEGENILFHINPVTSIVLGMDGEVAEFIEYSKFTCKVGYGRNGGGSGGYPLVVVIEDVIYDLDLVRSGWKVVNLGWDSPVLLVEVDMDHFAIVQELMLVFKHLFIKIGIINSN